MPVDADMGFDGYRCGLLWNTPEPVTFPMSFHPDPIIQAERQMEEVLNNLVSTGALQKNNQMDIESLLNPEGKCHVIMTKSTDMEIYQDVMDTRAARDNIEINGGNDLDEGMPIELQPSWHNILNTTYMISKYLSSINDPNAPKIEPLLSEL